MLLVTTSGPGSMDLYASALAARLPQTRQFPAPVFKNGIRHFNTSLVGSNAARSVLVDIRFVRALRREREPVHFPNHHFGRYGLFMAAPYVVTVHDLIRYFDLQRNVPFIHQPNTRDRLYLGLDYAGIKRATAIIAVSQTTKADLVEHLGVPDSNVHVVYEGVDSAVFHPVDARPFEFPYILYVGSEQPRKNLRSLIQALAELKRSGRHPDLKLVKVGAPGGREADFRRDTERLLREHAITDSVVLVDRVHAAALPAYYAGAVCTVLPSLYEGFGLPLLEAMACGSPVVTSSAGSLPEIAGDAALIVSPRDPVALAAAIERILTEPALREELQRRGLQRAATFSWDRTAAETRAVYDTIERRQSGVDAIPTSSVPASRAYARPHEARGVRAYIR